MGEICSSPAMAMKKIVTGDDISLPPEEIILNILKQLPAKSRFRFQLNLIVPEYKLIRRLLPILHSNGRRRTISSRGSYQKHSHATSGFGFSPILDDYKILIIHPTRYSAQVYSVGSGSWNGVDCTILNDWHDLHDDPITVNGFMYWIGSKEDENDLFVVSFDMAMELFTLISPISPREGRGTIKLTVYENKLGLLSVISENQNSFVTNLWVMEEVTVTMWNNEIVCDVYFGDECEPKIFLINITTSELKMVNDPLFNLDLCDAFNYVESLVAVGGIKSTTMFV
ncbi:F-box protein At2g21930-like [Prosopis cineraria]|uniref:F-box protein At2g21930-like n=1 Tax=Prosopis cineraria TaxID=364024 RepID=UPI00240FE167|nr:F-box protein At2g21930-like [Prosopis cineraria]